jgi:SAM-dependent methyltransferase
MHNILSDPLESESFYLVHARWVLCHLTEPEKALQKMVDALGPGGWLFIEEPDHESTLTSQFTETSQELVFNVSRAVFDHLKKSGVFDAYFGRKLRQLIENLSLEEVSHNGWTRLYRGGEPIKR